MTHQNADHILLICTAGGTPEPLAKSMAHWRPARVFFIHSKDTRRNVENVLLKYAEATGAPLPPGCYSEYAVEDPENLTGCLRTIRSLETEVRKWPHRGPQYRVVADFTGGTKCMSAALALQARRWPVTFSYVGGERRTKQGVGVVETGAERIVHDANPWDALGYQAIEDACLLFDQNAFAPAAALLEQARNTASLNPVKRALNALAQLCRAYDAWDRFQHQDAAGKLDQVLRNENDLREALGPNATSRLIRHIATNQRHLEQLDRQQPGETLVLDLLANAKRRADEGRYDDAVARLYRAIEAMAQLRLKIHHIDPANVTLDQVPDLLRQQWHTRAKNGPIRLGLQDDFILLQALNDELGDRFSQLSLADPQKSPLSARNQSILAHGFQPLTDAAFNALWRAAIDLGQINEASLPQFPKLAQSEE